MREIYRVMIEDELICGGFNTYKDADNYIASRPDNVAKYMYVAWDIVDDEE